MKNSADQGGCYSQRLKADVDNTFQDLHILQNHIRDIRDLHILRKLNSVIALLFMQNISPFLEEFRHFALCFFRHQI